ncbi:MAG: hypothetical protein ACTSYA_01865 [Candidatus Kariarchaeaceae archaeon]
MDQKARGPTMTEVLTRPSTRLEDAFFKRYRNIDRQQSKSLARSKKNNATLALIDEIQFCYDNKLSLMIAFLPGDYLIPIMGSIALLIQELTNNEIALRARREQLKSSNVGDTCWLFHDLNNDLYTKASPLSFHNHFFLFKVDRADHQAHFYLELDRIESDDEKGETIFVLNWKNDSGWTLGQVSIRNRFQTIDHWFKEESKKQLQSIVFSLLESVPQATIDLLSEYNFPAEFLFSNDPAKFNRISNDIESSKELFYGPIKSGKTTLMMMLHAQDLANFGKEHVHAILSEDDLVGGMMNGLSDNRKMFCQSLNFDDLTYEIESSDLFTQKQFRNLRHLLNEAYGGKRGNRKLKSYIIYLNGKKVTTTGQEGFIRSRFGLHRITGQALPTSLRDSFDWMFFLGVPTLKWDRDYIRSIMGEDYFAFLEYVDDKRKSAFRTKDKEAFIKWRGYGVYVRGLRVGVFRLHLDEFPQAEMKILEDSMSESDRLSNEVHNWKTWEIDLRNEAAAALASYHLWGLEKELPRWDIDMVEAWGKKEFSNLNRLVPKKRRKLCREIFKDGKFLRYLKLLGESNNTRETEEKEVEELTVWWESNWMRLAQIIESMIPGNKIGNDYFIQDKLFDILTEEGIDTHKVDGNNWARRISLKVRSIRFEKKHTEDIYLPPSRESRLEIGSVSTNEREAQVSLLRLILHDIFHMSSSNADLCSQYMVPDWDTVNALYGGTWNTKTFKKITNHKHRPDWIPTAIRRYVTKKLYDGSMSNHDKGRIIQTPLRQWLEAWLNQKLLSETQTSFSSSFSFFVLSECSLAAHVLSTKSGSQGNDLCVHLLDLDGSIVSWLPFNCKFLFDDHAWSSKVLHSTPESENHEAALVFLYQFRDHSRQWRAETPLAQLAKGKGEVGGWGLCETEPDEERFAGLIKFCEKVYELIIKQLEIKK